MEWKKLMAFLQSSILETIGLKSWLLERTYSRDLVAGACKAKAVVMPRNVSCGTSLSSFRIASLFVRHRARWLSNEQFCRHIPKPEFQVTLFTDCLKIAAWELVVQQMWMAAGKHCASRQIGVHQYNSFNCSFGLCCTFCVFTGKTRSALSVARARSAHLRLTTWVYNKEVAMSCCQDLLSKHSF